ncbi:hypothetical protein SUGI_0308920 [Cryptomeria japonica]|nr:hypothetical protein SUGI_0308920 [Cryptomeria japonica]
MLSQDGIPENLFSSNDDYYPEFVPSTQVNNEEVIAEKVVPTSEVEVTKNQSHVPSQEKSRVCWSIANTMVLIEAKQTERETQSSGGVMRRALNSTEKWKIIQEYCSAHGVHHTANQCWDRWEHIQPDYKRIRDYEHNIPSGHDSFWNTTSRERIEKKLPTKFIFELYDAMETTFGKDRAINPWNITIDSSDTSLAFDDNNLTNEDEPLNESDTPNMESTDNSKNGSKRDKLRIGKKRKINFQCNRHDGCHC